MAKPFPKQVFMRWEGDPPYLIGSPSLEEATDSESQTLAVYKLVDKVETKLVTKYRPKGTKEWAED